MFFGIIVEIVMTVAACVFMARVANMENRSVVVWTIGTAVLCFVFYMIIPLPYLRIFFAAGTAFAAMVVAKMVARR